MLDQALMDEICAEIRYWHRKRFHVMDLRKVIDSKLGWFLKTVLGWSKALPQREQEEIARNAAHLIGLAEAELRIAELSQKPELTGPEKGKLTRARKRLSGGDSADYWEWRDVIMADVAARLPFDRIEKSAENELERLVEELPVWLDFAENIKGFGLIGLSVIVGEAGNLAKYPDAGLNGDKQHRLSDPERYGPDCLWKRMGVAVVDGVRQGGLSKSAAKADWIAHGYNRKRRSRLWTVGDSLIKGNGDGPYRQIYLTRKDYERQRAEANGLTVVPQVKIPKGRAAEFMSDGHVHRRAQRHMEKRLLRDLWQAWRVER